MSFQGDNTILVPVLSAGAVGVVVLGRAIIVALEGVTVLGGKLNLWHGSAEGSFHVTATTSTAVFVKGDLILVDSPGCSV